MSDIKELKELIDSFISYRNVLVPLQESLRSISTTYESIKTDLDNMNKTFSGNVAGQLDKIHSSVNSQAKNGEELTKKIAEYSVASEKYTEAVNNMTKKFLEISTKLNTVNEIEKSADKMIQSLDEIIAEKRTSYNLTELQKSLDGYNKNVEKISEFINKDIADVLKKNADKIENIRKENTELSNIVKSQGKEIASLTASFNATTALLRKTVESGSVNEEYLFDAFDKWAEDRKVKIKKK